jgi:hypothetical protein
MLKPKHSPFHKKLLDFYIHWQLNKQFQSLRLIGNIEQFEKSMLVIGNHISWWDGFWIWHLNKKVLKKTFHVMMLENELRPRKFFNKCGAYSINPGNISVRESLKTTVEILENSANMVLFYPEGEFVSMTQNQKKFKPGIEYILKKLPKECSILMQASFVDYFSNKKPTLTLYYETIDSNHIINTKELEAKYNSFYAKCMQNQQNFVQSQL